MFLSAAPAVSGMGQAAFWFLPSLLIALAYHRYEYSDPESYPIIQEKLNYEYDFIVGEYRPYQVKHQQYAAALINEIIYIFLQVAKGFRLSKHVS